MTGLADCNNFFVSCERTVDPSLIGKAVVVGSNNDGCVVARSNEAKKIGIKMGQPIFEIRDLISSGKVIAISGHHLLYREISIKVHDIFRRFVPSAIDYSVDEAFFDMNGIPVRELEEIGRAIVCACMDEVGIPVTVGFASTKTLAKIITEVTKKTGNSVGLMIDREQTFSILESLPISELWGVGRRLSKRMYQSGIYTIADFSRADRAWVRSSFGVNGERSWLELNGTPCIELSHVERIMQDSISETRTFPFDVDDIDYIRSRIAIYASDCAAKLRKMNGACRSVTTFLRTNRFHTENGIYCPEATSVFATPCSDTTLIVRSAIDCLEKIYSPKVAYKRAGVLLGDISRIEAYSPSLFQSVSVSDFEASSQSLMKVVDSLNDNIGHPMLRLASQLTKGHPGHNDGYSSSFQAPSAKKYKK